MKAFSSLFWKLYISILATILFVGLLFVSLLFYYDYTTEVDDFLLDTQFVAQPIL